MQSSAVSNGSDYSDEGEEAEDEEEEEELNANGNVTYDARKGPDIILAQEAEQILTSPAIINSLAVIERAIAQNIIHEKFLVYRNVPSISDILGPPPGASNDKKSYSSSTSIASSPASSSANSQEEKEEKIALPAKRLERLWSFKCALTAGRAVSGALFDPLNSDLLAVSYGQYDFSLERKDGLLCLW